MQRLRRLRLDDVVTIDGVAATAGGPPVLYEQVFHVDDGWDLREVAPGVFSILREEMDEPVIVGGYGYSYTRLPEPEEPTPLTEREPKVEAPPRKKGKRHAHEGK